MARTANDIAALFWNGEQEPNWLPSAFPGCTRQATSRWLSAKQVNWLRDVWAKENGHVPGRHGKAHGQIVDAAHETTWSLYISPTGAGHITILEYKAETQ